MSGYIWQAKPALERDRVKLSTMKKLYAVRFREFPPARYFLINFLVALRPRYGNFPWIRDHDAYDNTCTEKTSLVELTQWSKQERFG